MTSQSAGRIEGPGAEDLFDEEGEEEDAQDHPHGGAKRTSRIKSDWG